MLRRIVAFFRQILRAQHGRPLASALLAGLIALAQFTDFNPFSAAKLQLFDQYQRVFPRDRAFRSPKSPAPPTQNPFSNAFGAASASATCAKSAAKAAAPGHSLDGRRLYEGRRDGFMPEYLDHPVKNWKTWEEDVKWRIDPTTPARYADLETRMATVAAKRPPRRPGARR